MNHEATAIGYERPLILTILLTYNCNLKCSFCGQNDIRRNAKSLVENGFKMALELEQIELILDDAVASGIRHVNLWGGEPLLHPQIFEIIHAIKKRYMRCFMVTNGTKLEELAEQIVASKLDFLQVSIDAEGDKHDKVRNHKGLYAKIQRGINKINGMKRIFPIISSSTVIIPDNVDYLSDIADRVIEDGFSTSFFQLLMSYPKDVIQEYKERLVEDYGFSYDDFKVIDSFEGEDITPEQYKNGIGQANQMKERHGKLVTYPDIFQEPDDYKVYLQTRGPIPRDKTKGCWSIDHKINVQPNGDVVLCPDFPDFKLGNLFEQSIMDIWNSEKRIKFLEDFYGGKPLPICYKCCQLWDKEEFGSWKGAK
ncbi:radical SAM protein [Paenibacillus pinihumi]|uniref:radical SAM protein n=1 Tax=Paenibacillus pinihumi TaxID=669462 RepID=UPI00041E4922|nr:radical SAM protein [Paenibacillus pinihumi]